MKDATVNRLARCKKRTHMEIGAKQYSRDPFLAATSLLVFWILFGMMEQVCCIRGAPRLPRPARGTHGSLKVAAHVLVKRWFAAPPCTKHCFVRKVKKCHKRLHLALALNPEFYLVPVRLLVQSRFQALGRLL